MCALSLSKCTRCALRGLSAHCGGSAHTPKAQRSPEVNGYAGPDILNGGGEYSFARHRHHGSFRTGPIPSRITRCLRPVNLAEETSETESVAESRLGRTPYGGSPL